MRTSCRVFLLALAVSALATGSARAQVPVGSFYYFEREDATGDRSSITTLARENFVSGAGGLTWSCEAGDLRVTLSSTYLGRGFRARVRWSLDEGPPSETEAWILMSSGMAVKAPVDVGAEFTRRALGARVAGLQVTDYQFRRYGYTFDLEGLAEALAMLPCGSATGP